MAEVEGAQEQWLDASKISLLHLCPQRFQWRHELGLVPKSEWKANAMDFGVAVHKALEALYDGSGFQLETCPCPSFEGCEFCKGQPIPRVAAQFLLYYPEDPIDDPYDPRTRSRGLHLLTSYVEKWRQPGFDVLAVEVPFTIPFPEFSFIGRIDLVGRWRDTGRLFPNDHKTTTRFGDLFTQQFKLSLQMTGYIVALERITGEPVDHAQINAIRVSKNVDEDSFQQFDTTRTQEEKDRFVKEVEAAWELLKHYRATDFFPRHAPFACSAYMRRCEYYSLCTSGHATQEDLIKSSFEVKPWTPIGAE